MKPAIVFFDDSCVLCSRSVQFIYRNDRKGRFCFASLDSQAFGKIRHLVKDNAEAPGSPASVHLDSGTSALETPANVAGPASDTRKYRDPGNGTQQDSSSGSEPGSDAGTVILYMNGKVYTRSAAALQIASRLRFPVWLLAAGWVVPPFLRNAVYDWIARNRYRWFGKRETCFVPSGGLKKRVLA
jgi:predicted DCC family thiol-disulfide oxidoreductase YuxK